MTCASHCLLKWTFEAPQDDTDTEAAQLQLQLQHELSLSIKEGSVMILCIAPVADQHLVHHSTTSATNM